MMVIYAVEQDLDPKEFKQVLINSTLGERRPVDDDQKIKRMVEGANLVVTARFDGKLVGVARSITDFVYCTYLSDLAVDTEFQRQGIGKELIRQTKAASPEGILILLSAPKAIDYYPKVGMSRHEHCFLVNNIDEIT